MLVLLSGVSGAGKDTIKNELIKRMDNVISMPSYTDRAPRPRRNRRRSISFCNNRGI